MRYKYKLSFSVLMISSCLVQIASTAVSRSKELAIVEGLGNGAEIPKGSALTLSLLSTNIVVGDGSVEIVENGATSIGSTIKKGGMQIVVRGGNAINAKILGGKQFIHEEKGLDLTSVVRRSSASNTTVSGGSGAVGQQNVYDGAVVWYTKVGNNGEQNLYSGERKEGGKSMYAEISKNGRQHVLALGESLSTTLKDNAVQVVYPEGFVDTLTITDFARSWFHSGIQKVVGEVRVNNHGELYLFAGDRTNHITKKKISIEGRADETIFEVGERNIGEKPQIEIEDLGGHGGTVIFTSIPYDPRHISLHVEKLSGDLHFRFNMSATWDTSDYLTIGDGSGNHKINVADSGTEITGPLSQKNGWATEINLITDKVGGANFTLEDHSGNDITTVDGGTYQYQLLKRERCADSSGYSTIWYLSRVSGGTTRSNTEGQCVNKKTKFPLALSDQGASSGGKKAGRRPSNKEQPKPRPPRHLRETQKVSSVLASSSQENQTRVVLPSSVPHPLSDEKQQAAVSTSSPSLADQ
uniref:pertactin-like passenger domain-containing protein n=1 Tax=Bartonella sp. AD13SXNS TaxID=3243462 RepID=UPI0035D09B66